jgi:micrococcal nuclease
MYQYKAEIVRVIDGDTAVLNVDLGFFIWLRDLHFRFYGIDTPEKSDKTGWLLATEFTKAFFERNPKVIVNVYGMDKYGRWLGEFVDPFGGTLNEALVEKGLAKSYFP